MRQAMVKAGVLEVAVELHGPAEGPPVILLHGFPDDARAWDGVAPALAAAGHFVVVPYLRGYGPTRFLDAATPRSGQQAALGADLLALMDAMGIGRALLAGYVDPAGAGGAGTALLVPMVPAHRSRCGGAGGGPGRLLPVAVAFMVAWVAVHGCRIRAHRGKFP